LKKVAKPYKFLNFEKKYIYPVVIRGYVPDAELDMSRGGEFTYFSDIFTEIEVSSIFIAQILLIILGQCKVMYKVVHHMLTILYQLAPHIQICRVFCYYCYFWCLLNYAIGAENPDFQHNPLNSFQPLPESDGATDGDGIQLTKGFTNSSGPLTGGTVYGDSDSLW
jgi:hypothetical protein